MSAPRLSGLDPDAAATERDQLTHEIDRLDHVIAFAHQVVEAAQLRLDHLTRKRKEAAERLFVLDHTYRGASEPHQVSTEAPTPENDPAGRYRRG